MFPERIQGHMPNSSESELQQQTTIRNAFRFVMHPALQLSKCQLPAEEQ